MLKKLFLPIIFGLQLCAPTIKGMEQSGITFEGPFKTFGTNIKINAQQNNQEIGSILYEFFENQRAKITLFLVKRDARNNKKGQRIGQQLFQKCVDDVIAHNCKQLIWTVSSIDDLDCETVCTIYKKIVTKLKNSESYLLTKSEIYGRRIQKVDMTLSFNKDKKFNGGLI